MNEPLSCNLCKFVEVIRWRSVYPLSLSVSQSVTHTVQLSLCVCVSYKECLCLVSDDDRVMYVQTAVLEKKKFIVIEYLAYVRYQLSIFFFNQETIINLIFYK